MRQMIRGIHHISLKCAVADMFERAKGFYLDVLGLTLAREWPEGAMMDTGCGLIELFCNGEGVRAKGAIRHVALLTDDVDGMAARAAAAGYRVFIEPGDIEMASSPVYRARMAFCEGPRGEEIELFQQLG